MLTKLSQQQLETIRDKYLQQNKTLAQQNSSLMMKCTALENKISELLKQNTAYMTEKLIVDKQYRDNLTRLENVVDTKFQEILCVVKELQKAADNGSGSDMGYVPKEKLERKKNGSIKVDKIIEEAEEAQEEHVGMGMEVALEGDAPQAAQLEVEVPAVSSTTNNSPVEEQSPFVDDVPSQITVPVVTEDTTRADSKRRRSEVINQLRHKVRRRQSEVVDLLEVDELIVSDSRRDSIGNWLVRQDTPEAEAEPVIENQEQQRSPSIETEPGEIDLAGKVEQDVIEKSVEPTSSESDKENQQTNTTKRLIQNVETKTKVKTKAKAKPKKKQGLTDISAQQNIVKSIADTKTTADSSTKHSIFDFIDDDKIESKTIFNSRKNRRRSSSMMS